MSITFELGYWIVPTLITFICFVIATIASVKTSGKWLSGLAAIFFYVVAIIASIITWLTWGVVA